MPACQVFRPPVVWILAVLSNFGMLHVCSSGLPRSCHQHGHTMGWPRPFLDGDYAAWYALVDSRLCPVAHSRSSRFE